MATVLYTPAVLALATDLGRWPPQPGLPFHGSARSAACGSTLGIDLGIDGNRRICALGLSPRACAIGQAGAAIFAQGAVGQDRAAIAEARDALGAWLRGEGPMPAWPGLSALSAVPSYPGRHGAVMLAWNAALDALGGGETPR